MKRKSYYFLNYFSLYGYLSITNANVKVKYHSFKIFVALTPQIEDVFGIRHMSCQTSALQLLLFNRDRVIEDTNITS